MKNLYLIALVIIAYILVNLDYTDPNSGVTVRQLYESLFDETDGNWEYMNSFKHERSSDAIKCMQQNIFFEAATETTEGRLAVGMVTINRVKSPKFPNTVCGVIRQAELDSNGNPIRHKCQFSWFCDGVSDTPNLSNPVVLNTWSDIEQLSHKIINEENVSIVGGSTFYHSTKVKPTWGKKLKLHSIIGGHVFYTESS